MIVTIVMTVMAVIVGMSLAHALRVRFGIKLVPYFVVLAGCTLVVHYSLAPFRTLFISASEVLADTRKPVWFHDEDICDAVLKADASRNVIDLQELTTGFTFTSLGDVKTVSTCPPVSLTAPNKEADTAPLPPAFFDYIDTPQPRPLPQAGCTAAPVVVTTPRPACAVYKALIAAPSAPRPTAPRPVVPAKPKMRIYST